MLIRIDRHKSGIKIEIRMEKKKRKNKGKAKRFVFLCHIDDFFFFSPFVRVAFFTTFFIVESCLYEDGNV